MAAKPVIAVCGKGGVGKTAVSALLSRVLLDEGVKPLLLIDADPAMGLVSAIGEKRSGTLADVRDRLISSARSGGKSDTAAVVDQLNYMVFEALVERENYALLSMGHSAEKGCFCPANTLLREAIDLVSASFSLIVIDAEAGIEQIKRDVTRSVNLVIVVIDGSQRSMDTLRLISELVDKRHIRIVANRVNGDEVGSLPAGMDLIGAIPQDQTLMKYDRIGRPIWELPLGNPALAEAEKIAQALNLI